MSTATDSPVKVGTLVPLRINRRWSGFGNLLRKELREWWTTKLWWVQTLIWVAPIVGISAIVAANSEGMSVAEHFIEVTSTPFLMSTVVVGIGVVVTVQSAIVGEKDQGTAAWVLSKPASRASFVMAKIIGHSFGFLVTAILIPFALYAIVSEAFFPGMLDYSGYLVGVAVVTLSMFFYVTLTVCLGTFFRGRGPIAGIGIAFILIGQLLNGFFPVWLILRTPWPLGDAAASFAVDVPPDWSRMTPIVTTAVASVVLCLVALRRFGRDEF